MSNEQEISHKSLRIYCKNNCTVDCWTTDNETMNKPGIGCFPTCVNLNCPQGVRECMDDEKVNCDYCEKCCKSVCKNCACINYERGTSCWICILNIEIPLDIAKFFVLDNGRFAYKKDFILQELGTEKGTKLIDAMIGSAEPIKD